MLEGELGTWRAAGHEPRFWWRDDDARQPSPALVRLMDLSAAHGAPIALAIIPDVDLAPIGEAIDGRPLVTAIQHGCDHVDRAGPPVSAEFQAQTAPEEVAEAIQCGWARLSAATPAAPIYAPPWNVLTPNVATALTSTALRAVSLYGGRRGLGADMIQINAHIDIMSWRPQRFRGAPAILGRIWRQMRSRRRRRSWSEPIGLLTHHRNLDVEAWDFLAAFLARGAAARSPIRWRCASELLVEAREIDRVKLRRPRPEWTAG